MKKAGSIFLVFAMLFATVGVYVSHHFCGGRLASVSMYAKATCACSVGQMDEGCCQQQATYNRLDAQYQTVSHHTSFGSKWVQAFTAGSIEVWNGPAITFTREIVFKPPLIEQDRPVLFRVFLI